MFQWGLELLVPLPLPPVKVLYLWGPRLTHGRRPVAVPSKGLGVGLGVSLCFFLFSFDNSIIIVIIPQLLGLLPRHSVQTNCDPAVNPAFGVPSSLDIVTNL